ncbi:MAG: ABC transporter permease [Oscillospiraceae bacterium]|nr:ABC transporter permease [Oscillospiraceae bacterium]
MKKSLLLGRILTVIVFVFLYVPIAVLVVFSFNASKSRKIWSGFTLDWYRQLFHNQMIMNSFYVTLTVSIIAAVVATIVGTFAAVGFFNMKKQPRGVLLAINQLPVINADIITGVSMMLLFVSAKALMGFEFGFGTLLIAHITFNIPYVILSVMPKLYQLDNNLFEAAQDLGATWMKAFFKVILPEIRPGIVNGLLIAFTMSIDDFVISYFTAGSHLQTLSMTIYSMTRRRISPEINALSTLLFAVVLGLLLIVNLRQMKQNTPNKN